MLAHVAGRHLGLEERRSPLDEGIESLDQAGGRRRAESARPRVADRAAPDAGPPTGTPTGPPPPPWPIRCPPGPGILRGHLCSSPAERSMTASSRASLEGNQYRIDCLRTPRPSARASREVAS